MAKVQQLPEIFDAEAEQSVLGAIFLDPTTLLQIADRLMPQHFHLERHRTVYQTILDLKEQHKPIDLTSVTGELFDRGEAEKVGAPVFLAELSEHVGTTANIEYYVNRVIDRYVIRLARQRAKEIIAATDRPTLTSHEILDYAEHQFYDLSKEIRQRPIVSLGIVNDQEISAIDAVFQGHRDSGMSTGFSDLDRVVLFQPTDLIILAGRPSMGKTSLGFNIALRLAPKRITSAIFSLEMSKGQLSRRALSALSGVPGENINRAQLSPDAWVNLYAARDKMATWSIYIDDTPAMNLLNIRSQCRQMKSRGQLDLVIIDYLSLIKPIKRGRSREEEVAEISRGVKATAKELEIPIILIAQLNRDLEKRPDKRPRLSDLRESGAIEQDADTVIFIYREEMYRKNAEKGVAEILVRKQRNGRTGDVRLAYNEECLRFDNLARIV